MYRIVEAIIVGVEKWWENDLVIKSLDNTFTHVATILLSSLEWMNVSMENTHYR